MTKGRLLLVEDDKALAELHLHRPLGRLCARCGRRALTLEARHARGDGTAAIFSHRAGTLASDEALRR
jgi:hypothetical protein